MFTHPYAWTIVFGERQTEIANGCTERITADFGYYEVLCREDKWFQKVCATERRRERKRRQRSSEICHACSEQQRAVRKAQRNPRDPLWCQSEAAADCRRESLCFNQRTQWMTIAEEALGLIEILLLLFPEKYSRPPTSTGAASLRGSTTWSRISRLLIITRSVTHTTAYSG